MNSRLKEAARRGNRELLLSLIHQGADVNAVMTPRDSSALIEASLHGHGDCVRELIDLGADLDHRDKHQMTAMWYAIQRCHVYCLQLLVIAWVKKQFGTRKFTLRFIDYTETGNFESISVIFRNPDFQAAWTDDNKDMAMFFLLTYDSSLNVLAEAIDAGANINACMTQILSPVLLAIIQNKPHQLEFLLRFKPEVNIWLNAMKECNMSMCTTRDNEFEDCMHQLFAEKPVNLNSVLKGKTLYMFASLARDGQCLKLLMKYFGDIYVNEIDMECKTALMYASAADNRECVKLLLDNKADANIKCNEGRTALMYAASNGCFESLEVLAKCEYSLSEGDIKGKTAVMYAAESGSTQCLSLLLEIDDFSHLNDNEGMSALMHASKCGHSNCVSLLLSHGASVNDINLVTGESVIMYALKSGNFDCVKVLLNNGVNICEGKRKGKSELIHAILGDNPDCVNEMLRRGCNVRIDKPEVIRSVIASGNVIIVQKLIKAGVPFDKDWIVQVVAQTLMKGNDNMIATLFKLQPDALAPRHRWMGRSFLMYAALSGSLETVELFVDHGHDVHEVCRDDGKSVLMHAAEGGNAECVGLLLSKGARVRDLDSMGCSALMYASQGGYEKCIRDLLEHNARVDMKDTLGRTALLHAAIHGYHHEKCMNALVSFGADVNCVDKEGQSPLIYSAKKGDLHTVQTLLKRGASVSVVDGTKESAASYAVIHGHYNCLRSLMECKRIDCDSASAYETSLQKVFHRCSYKEMYTMMLSGVFRWNWLNQQEWTTVKNASYALIKAGMQPGTFLHLHKTSTILDLSLTEHDLPTSKLLVKHLYMCRQDKENLKVVQSKLFTGSPDKLCDDIGDDSDILRSGDAQCPFSLRHLCLLTVSWNIRPSTVYGEREKMVACLPIPDKLQKVLNFRSSVFTC